MNQINNEFVESHRPMAARAYTFLKISVISASVLFALGCAVPSDKNTQDDVAQEQKQSVNETEKRERLANQTDEHAVPAEAESEAATLDMLLEQVKANRVSEAGIDAQREAAFRSQRIVVTGSRLAAHPSILYDVPQQPANQENYNHLDENGVKVVSIDPVSTFSVDVDTGSYSNSRRMLNQGNLPPSDAVRTEEFINYFDYDYAAPESIERPFSVNTAIAVSPWNKERHLMRIALKGFEPESVADKGSNLVFLLDVSGSMERPNKLPLLKRSLAMLTKQLDDKDKVSIVVYAGASGVVLEPTPGNRTADITRALGKLSAGGSTNGAAGIQLAYQLAQKAFIKGGVNRVILATDGDFNVGMVNHDSLIDLIEKKKEEGVALTTLGFGDGNYNDHLMEQLADAGNGNYAYIDNINEARKVLVDEVGATMQMIAKDVKIQVEFNPSTVAEYRLLGYENRVLANEDFKNDKVDAGDIGAGHTVTALYELTLKGSSGAYNDELRYGKKTLVNNLGAELANVKLRFKKPTGSKSEQISQVVSKDEIIAFEQQGDDFRFSTAVAGFAQLMKNTKFSEGIDFPWIINTAVGAKGDDEFGYRSEFIGLVRSASELEPLIVESGEDFVVEELVYYE